VVDISDEEIVEMIFFGVVDEAARVLDEDVVVRSADLDIASVLGMGFPAYRYYTVMHCFFHFQLLLLFNCVRQCIHTYCEKNDCVGLQGWRGILGRFCGCGAHLFKAQALVYFIRSSLHAFSCFGKGCSWQVLTGKHRIPFIYIF
jgi:hypothetical protein